MTDSTEDSSSGVTRDPALDGIRGIAITLVILSHWFLTSHGKDLIPRSGWKFYLAPVMNGDLGVLVFFVLSGYLITGILLREKDKFGTISLGNFYRRRILRIWPAFYVFLGIMGILALLHVFRFNGMQFASAGLFIWNYSPAAHGNWWLGHTWSLAVEEQFYLLWPLLLLVVRLRTAIVVAVSLILMDPLIRILQYLVFPGTRGNISIYFHTRMDSLLMGALVALVAAYRPDLFAEISSWLTKRKMEWVALATLCFCSWLTVLFRGSFALSLGWSLENLATAVILVVVLYSPYTGVRRRLSFRPLVFVGAVSFGLYLWQQLFTTDLNQSALGRSPLGVLLLALIVCLSWLFMEKPILRLKSKFSRK